MPTQICVFNPATNLIDVTNGVSAYTGSPSTAGAPLVLNALGALDSSFLISNPITAIASETLSTGALVNLYYSTTPDGVGVYAQLANAASASSLPAMGFVTAAVNSGATVIISTEGIVNVAFTTGFAPDDVGQPVYLSTTVPGGVQLTAPTNPDLIQPLGFIYQVGGTSNSYVQFPFLAFPLATFNQTPVATVDSIGTVQPDGTSITINGSGVISATGSSFTTVNNEIPSGVVNGTNNTFTLAHTPNPVSSLKLYLSGLRMIAEGVDYTLTGNSISYVIVPLAGSPHVCDYTY